jgi:hypothetical protein
MKAKSWQRQNTPKVKNESIMPAQRQNTSKETRKHNVRGKIL